MLPEHYYHQQEVLGSVTIEGMEPKTCRVVLELIAGGKDNWTATGEVCVAIQTPDGQSYNVLRPYQSQLTNRLELPLTDFEVEPVLDRIEASLAKYDDLTRRQMAASQDEFWRRRHDLARTIIPVADAMAFTIDDVITAKNQDKGTALAAVHIISDEAFLRRIYFDTVGVPPTIEEINAFLSFPAPTRRKRMIDQLLADPRCADHRISFWLDLLAENPTLINASLNSTGPFRWFLYDALRDNKPLDRMVTEMIVMRGGREEGGSAGFAMAAENDAPYAAKAHIIASAFLGIELQCARCHDAPYHSTMQEDLYSLAAMLERKSVTVPKSSRVPIAFFENKSRESLIQVTLKPDQKVLAKWPFTEVTGVADTPQLDKLHQNPSATPQRHAAAVQ